MELYVTVSGYTLSEFSHLTGWHQKLSETDLITDHQQFPIPFIKSVLKLKMTKLYCLIDATRFYSESTSIYKPEQRNLPVLVTAGQGISIAANRVSTNLGIAKFIPIFQEIDKIRHHNGLIYKSNFSTYGHISERFMLCIEKYAAMHGAVAFRYSVDEIFLSIDHITDISDIEEFASKLRRKVYKETGVATACGVGSTLTLSKAGSWAAKNIQGYSGQCIISNQKQADDILKSMSLNSVWNIGERYSKHLTNDGITNAYQLKQSSAIDLQRRYTINIANVIHELNGLPVLRFDTIRQKKQQIWSTRSYRDRLKTETALFSELAYHCCNVMLKVREQKSEALKLSAFVSTSKFDTCPSFYRRVDIDLECGLSDSSFAIQKIRSVFDKLLPPSFHKQPVYKIGIGASVLLDAERKQYDLFQSFDNKSILNETLDALNGKYGKGIITYASQQRKYNEQSAGIEFKELEDYYTNVNDLLVVKCI